jgi:hypothetical protein
LAPVHQFRNLCSSWQVRFRRALFLPTSQRWFDSLGLWAMIPALPRAR